MVSTVVVVGDFETAKLVENCEWRLFQRPDEAIKRLKGEKKDDGWMEIGKNLGMKARWDYGLWVETDDKAFRIHAGGRTQFDGVWAQANDRVQFGKGGIGRLDDAVNFRRGRLEMDGWMYEVFDFFCEYDFFQTVNDDPTLPASESSNVINSPCPTEAGSSCSQLSMPTRSQARRLLRT